ncbi:MAG: hypothetical protein HY454_03040 [Parcubacteria group bacterium]|nr:hypothetical protein [Parcubacteria group bacterium]
MQIPQNILEELERRRQATLVGDPQIGPIGPISPIGPTEPATSDAADYVGHAPLRPPSAQSYGVAQQDFAGHGGSLFFDYLTRLAIFAAIFLTPLFFFNASDILGLPKQLLLSSLALTALAGWVCKIISSGQIVWRRNFLTWAALAVAASAVLSSVFSDSFWVSFLGDVGRYDFSGVSILAYVIMFIVAGQSLVRRDVKAALGLWLFSSFAVAALAALKFAGFSVLPWKFAEGQLFNTIGGPFSLSLFVLAGLPLAAAVWPEIKNRWQKIGLAVVVLVELALAVVIDFQSGWIALAVAGLALVAANFVRIPPTNADGTRTGADKGGFSSGGGETSLAAGGWSFQRSMALPAVLVVLAAALWLVGVPQIGALSFPAEINPSYRASLEVMAQTLKEKLVFGSGLETFPYVYAKFKSAALNQTNFWGVNFNNSMAEVITWVTTAGLLGAAAWLLFAAGFLIYAFRTLTYADLTQTYADTNAELRGLYAEGRGGASAGGQAPSSKLQAPSSKNGVRAGLLASWVFILASKFLYSTSLPLEFLFWLLPALFLLTQKQISPMGPISPITPSAWEYKFQVGSVKTLAVFFGLMVVLLGTLLGGYFSARRWIAELNFVKAVKAEAKAETRDQILDGINSAIITDPYEVRYFRVLTQALFQKMNDVVAAIQARPPAERQANAEESVQLRNLAVRAISSVQRTRLLDPKNVGVAVDAAESFRSLTAFVQGADDVAIQNYEAAVDLEPVNPFIRTQLGQLYLLKSGLLVQGFEADEDWLAKAKAVLDKALDLNPNYANARFFRALIIDHEGDKPRAWEEFRALQVANPDNQLVARIVQNLQYGLPALGMPPAPAMPPQAPAASETKGVPSSR